MHVIDHRKEDVADGEHRYDAVLAIGGTASVSRLRSALMPKGALVVVGGESGSTGSPGLGRQLNAAVLSAFVSQRLVTVLNKKHCSGPERLAELATTGRLVPCTEQSYPVTQAPDAVRRLKAGDIRGQVAITV